MDEESSSPTPSEPQAEQPEAWRHVFRIGSTGAHAKAFEATSKLVVDMKDDLIANGIVEVVVKTATFERVFVTALLASWLWLIYQLQRRRWPISPLPGVTFVAQFIVMGLGTWLLLPYRMHLSFRHCMQIAFFLALGGALFHLTVQKSSLRSPQTGWLALGWAGLGVISALALVRPAAPRRVSEPIREKPVSDVTQLPTPPAVLPTPRFWTVLLRTPVPPPNTPTPQPIATPAPSPTHLAAEAACPPLRLPRQRPPGATHRVLPGESLSALATRYGVTVALLVEANAEYYPTLREYPACIREDWHLIIPEPGQGWP